MNKKHLFLFLFLVFPLVGFAASFERDLYVGLSGDDDVKKLQQLLTDQKLYSGPINGNFFSLTQAAVKKFQEAHDIVPVAGYFGPKTRIVANRQVSPDISSDRQSIINFLTGRIKALQEQLIVLQAQLKREEEIGNPPPATSFSPDPVPIATPPVEPSPAMGSTTTPLVVAGVKFGGESTTTFPATVILTQPFKIGDIVIRNDTNEPLLFSQLVFDIYDAMNSTLNRGREISLFLRQGSTTSDTLISKTKFSFSSSTPPVLDGVHRYQVNTEYPILFAAGETKSAGFWVENLDYVIGGTLKFALYDIQVTRAINRFHGFSFLLTR